MRRGEQTQTSKQRLLRRNFPFPTLPVTLLSIGLCDTERITLKSTNLGQRGLAEGSRQTTQNDSSLSP